MSTGLSPSRRATRPPAASKTRSVEILGSRVDIVDADDAVATVQGWIESRDGRCRQVVVSGFHALWGVHRDPEFKRMVNSAALWLPDGIAPVWIARLRGIRAGVPRARGRVHGGDVGQGGPGGLPQLLLR